MSDQAVREILQRLDVVGAKLGVAGDVIWAALLRQQMIDGVMNVLFAVMLLCAGFAAFYHSRKAFLDGSFNEEPKAWILAVCCVACVVFFMVSLNGAITDLFNPQYAALSDIGRIMAGK